MTKPGSAVIVCGSSTWQDIGFVGLTLDRLAARIGTRKDGLPLAINMVLTGGRACGVDLFAEMWCADNNVWLLKCPPPIGPNPQQNHDMRNAMILAVHRKAITISECISFPGGDGTQEMRHFCEYVLQIPVSVFDPG